MSGIKAPLSKGAACELPTAIRTRGIQAVGVYEFALRSGEFAEAYRESLHR